MRYPLKVVGLSDYLSEKVRVLNKEAFERKLRTFVNRHNNSIVLKPEVVDSLFEICDEYLRTVSGFSAFERDRVGDDLAKTTKLCKSVARQLRQLNLKLQRDASDQTYPLQSSVAKHALRQIAVTQKELEHFWEEIGLRARASNDLLRLAPLKYARRELVKSLDDYISRIYPAREQKEKDIVLAAAMGAINEFGSTDLGNDVLVNIPMARFRATKLITKRYVQPRVPMTTRKIPVSEIEVSPPQIAGSKSSSDKTRKTAKHKKPEPQ